MHPCLLRKVNKEFGSLRNEENKISSNEIKEVLEEGDEGQHNKILNSKSEELKDNIENPCRNAAMEYIMNKSEEWKRGKIICIQTKSIGKYTV